MTPNNYSYDHITPFTYTVTSGVPPTTSTHSIDLERDYVDVRGWNIKDFQRKRKAGVLLPTTPYQRIEIKQVVSGNVVTTFDDGHLYESNGWIHYGLDNALTHPDLTDPPDINTNVLVQAAAANVWQKGYDVLTPLTELSKLGPLLISALNHMLVFTRGLPKNVTLSKVYLEGRYGWRPLHYDVKNIIEVLTSFDDKRERFSKRVGTSYSDANSGTFTRETSGARYRFKYTDTLIASYRGGIVADFTPSKWRFEVLTTALERVPFSFIVNWVFSICNALASAQLSVHAAGYSCYTGSVTEIQRILELDEVEEIYDPITSSIVGAYKSEYTRYTASRSPVGLPTLPIYSVNLDFFKVLDFAAIFKEIFRNRAFVRKTGPFKYL